jgi:hypothetical protein
LREAVRLVFAACVAAHRFPFRCRRQAPKGQAPDRGDRRSRERATPLTGGSSSCVEGSPNPSRDADRTAGGGRCFAIDLEQLRAGQAAVVDSKSALGYPVPLASLPPGDYYAQAIVNVYEPVKRADGKTIWVHINDGTQEVMQIAGGNVYSEVQKIHVGARGAGPTVRLRINKTIEAQPRPQDTEWVKHVRIQSQKLTAFWGRPIYVHATVLLPKGYNERTSVRYPTVYAFGHNVPFKLQPRTRRACAASGRSIRSQATETGYDFYKSWDRGRVPALHRCELRAGDAVSSSTRTR